MEVLLHGHRPDRLLRPLHRRDSLITTPAFGHKDPVKVVNAVDFVVKVYSEGDAVQAVVTHAAAEAARVLPSVWRMLSIWRILSSMMRWPQISHLLQRGVSEMTLFGILVAGKLLSIKL